MKRKSCLSFFCYGAFSLLSGISLTLAFAPFHLVPFAIIAPAFLLFIWLKSSPKKAAMLGFLFGLGFFSSSCYWIYNSIYQYAHAPLWVSILITFTFILTLSLFFAAQGFLARRWTSHTTSLCLMAFPATWVLLEWIRSWFLSGFPWLFLGYAATSTPLIGFSPILGIYGLSLLFALTSGALCFLFTTSSRLSKVIIF